MKINNIIDSIWANSRNNTLNKQYLLMGSTTIDDSQYEIYYDLNLEEEQPYIGIPTNHNMENVFLCGTQDIIALDANNNFVWTDNNAKYSFINGLILETVNFNQAILSLDAKSITILILLISLLIGTLLMLISNIFTGISAMIALVSFNMYLYEQYISYKNQYIIQITLINKHKEFLAEQNKKRYNFYIKTFTTATIVLLLSVFGPLIYKLLPL